MKNNNSFHKIDLHIHTPASKCYRGENSNDEFFKILKKAKQEKLEIIAITDHNTIEGYERLIAIKDKIQKDLKEKQDSKSFAIENKLILKKKLKLFNDILILPGIEFETMDNVHLLIVFNPNTSDINTIKDFLIAGGYDKESFGFHDTIKIANWNILALYQATLNYDCFIIDAHTDSNKGIYNTIKPCKYRAKCFNDEQLLAIAYNSETTKDKLTKIIKTTDEYKRNLPISFVKFSDAHSVKEIGSSYTWVKLNTISFEEIKEAFRNPGERVSIEPPAIKRKLENLLKNELSFGILDLSKENKEYFVKLVCALSNSVDGGYCLFGVNHTKNKIGLDIKDGNSFKKQEIIYLKSINDCINKIVNKEDLEIRFTTYKLNKNKIIISLRINKSEKFVSIENEGVIYSIKNNKLVILSAREFQTVVEREKIYLLENKVAFEIEKIKKECNLIKCCFSSFPILNSFEEKSRKLFKIIRGFAQLANVTLKEEEIKKLRKIYYRNENGKSRGTIFYTNHLIRPRLPYTYLRYSPPIFYFKYENRNVLKSKKNIIIVPGGAVFLAQKHYPIYCEMELRPVSFFSRFPDIYKNEFIVAFLKSSFNIWYMKNKFNSIDIYNPKIFLKIRIPNLDKKNKPQLRITEEIVETVNQILSKEKKFLTDKLDSEIVEIHNKDIDILSYFIDEKIYELLGISKDQIKTIEDFLSINRIYLPQKN